MKEFYSALYEVQNQEQQQAQGSTPPQTTKPLIQRVSPLLLDKKADFQKCFEPRLVAFGPLHHGNPKFQRAEQYKLKFAARFVHVSGTNCDDLFKKVKAQIDDLRKCYTPEDVEAYDDDKLAWMLFVDGCAVLCAVRYVMEGMFDELNTRTYLLVFAQLDLFLQENQLPYKLLKILIGSAKDPPRLRDELLTGKKMKIDSSVMGRMLLSSGVSRKHRKMFRSIKELKESGIHVKPSTTNNLKDISFYCNFLGTLMMPRLLFLNLVALEMCQDFKNDSEVTSYLCFMDALIESADDVKELRDTGMLHNYLGKNEEVAELFKKMSGGLVPDQTRYIEVIDDIHNTATIHGRMPWLKSITPILVPHGLSLPLLVPL
uniref:Uncharacterized protein n=1 Tax=Gossypium raimondii TaxID=29730 RepID=A0A0D2TSE7_GOSRA|nr:hypothetical protein B456_013G002200 [Gossypium raimondii]